MRKDLLILAGFLGSGKTTLLGNILARNRERKIGVLINDFGEAAVDATLIRRRHGDITLSEINGGSIFCSCRQDSFVKALSLLAEQDVREIIVEASGNSDPTRMCKILRGAGLEDVLRHKLTLCLFDPVKSLKLARVLEVIPHQVRAADVILLSKFDLTTPEERGLAAAYVRELNPAAPLLEIARGELDLSLLPERRAERGAEESSFQPGVNRPGNFSLRETADLGGLLRFLGENEDVLRVKGYILTPEGTFFISDTGRGFERARSADAPVPLNILCKAGKAVEVEDRVRTMCLAG